jgi:hypothetical protein
MGAGGGGDIMAAIGRMGFGNPSTSASGGDPAPPIGGVGIPPADMRDPFGGPEWNQAGGDPGRTSQLFNNFFNSGFGNFPQSGTPISGGTQVPTFWSNNNTGNPSTYAPLPIPTGGWVDASAGALPHSLQHAGQHLSTT